MALRSRRLRGLSPENGGIPPQPPRQSGQRAGTQPSQQPNGSNTAATPQQPNGSNTAATPQPTFPQHRIAFYTVMQLQLRAAFYEARVPLLEHRLLQERDIRQQVEELLQEAEAEAATAQDLQQRLAAAAAQVLHLRTVCGDVTAANAELQRQLDRLEAPAYSPSRPAYSG